MAYCTLNKSQSVPMFAYKQLYPAKWYSIEILSNVRSFSFKKIIFTNYLQGLLPSWPTDRCVNSVCHLCQYHQCFVAPSVPWLTIEHEMWTPVLCTIKFLQNVDNRDIGCLLWAHNLTHALPPPLLSYIWYFFILGTVIISSINILSRHIGP